MEEENGEDSEMIDAMEGWDSDQDDANKEAGAGAQPQAQPGAAQQEGQATTNGGTKTAQPAAARINAA